MNSGPIRFADIQLLRYHVPDFESLTLQQKKYIYYLSEAALAGRDILWNQNCRYNLPIRHMLEAVYGHLLTLSPSDLPPTSETQAFLTYLRRVWFANGIHHHYSTDKFTPGFSEAFLRKTLAAIHYPDTVTDDEGHTYTTEELIHVIFDPTILPKRVNQQDGQDLLLTSAMNYYAPDITQAEAEAFYADDDPSAPSYGISVPSVGHFPLNSRLEHDAYGRLIEKTWKSGGLYGPIIDRIIYWLGQAADVAESDQQRTVITTLIDFYRTGDLRTFDRYTILWVQLTQGKIDFINGFTEVYGDPLGLKASWEGYVNIRDEEASERTRRLCQNAQWFEDHSPTDPRFKKSESRGVSASVVNVAMLGGDLYPASAIGINLPNSDYVRQHYGSKSVTLGNLTHAYAEAARDNGFYEEFVHPTDFNAQFSKLNSRLDDLHTDLHECLGHGSGQLLPGVSANALGPYGSTIEEARADLFALYFIADPKMVELRLVPDAEAYHTQYYSYMMNGLLTQLVRIEPGRQIEEAHMRNRAIIARWCLAHGDGAVQLFKADENQPVEATAKAKIGHSKTYLRINSYPALRQAIGRLLAEVQRIKSEGDYEAARLLVEEYGIHVDPDLHKEILDRYRRLNIAPYKGFINPRLTPVHDAEGHITDITISYEEDYDHQMLRYGRLYRNPKRD